MANGATTAKHLKEHLNAILDDVVAQNPEAEIPDTLQIASALEDTFGPEIHDMIDGFINYAEAHPKKFRGGVIQMVLCHDINGGMAGDKKMLPRTSEYAKYATVEVKRAPEFSFFPDVDEEMLKLFNLVQEKVIERLEMDIDSATKEDVLPILDDAREDDEEFNDYVGGFGFAIIEENIDLFIEFIKYQENHGEVYI